MKFHYLHSRINPADEKDLRTKTMSVAWYVDSENPRKITVAVAFRSPKDHFCRKTGRNIAAGRIQAGQGFSYTRNDDSNRYEDQLKSVLTMLDSLDYDSWKKLHRPGWW